MKVLCRVASGGLRAGFRIGHVALQLETLDLARSCTLRPADVV